MDWGDMKESSSQWDWDNLMLFPSRGTDIGKKVQWENDTAAGGGGHAEMDSGMQNGMPLSVSVDFSAKVDRDLCKIKVESMEPGYVEDRNVGFLDLRSQMDSRTDETDKGKSSEIRPNGDLNGFGTKEHQESQRSYVVKEMDKMDKSNTSLTVAVTASGSGEGDSHIGLKLGKRTYFEDASANSGCPIKATAVLALPDPPPSSAPAKKPRGLSQSMQSPRCQVEGCNTDLTSTKDYHRRHKVCQIHSKSAKVMVNGQEQRFCQQCSRFHILSEFDDVKRSCRRRLAGHNERRRKPQPDSIASNSSRLCSSFYDSSRNGPFMDKFPFVPQKIFPSSVLDVHNDFKLGYSKGVWPRSVKTEDPSVFDGHLQTPGVNRQSYTNALSYQHSDKLLMLLQSTKGASGDVLNQGIHNYTQSPANPVTQALTLSPSSGTGILGALEMASATESLSGVSDKGCALSLLSEQWGSRAPGSASLDLATRPGFALDHFMPENHSPMTQIAVQGMQHNFGLVTNGYSASGVSSLDKAHQRGSLVSHIGDIGNYESPMRGLLQEQELRSSHDSRSRRTIDLMQRSSQTHSNESQRQSGIVQHGNGQFMEFQLMRSYEPSVFDSHHM